MSDFIRIEKDEVGIVKDGYLHCVIKKTLQYDLLKDLEGLYPDSEFHVVEDEEELRILKESEDTIIL